MSTINDENYLAARQRPVDAKQQQQQQQQQTLKEQPLKDQQRGPVKRRAFQNITNVQIGPQAQHPGGKLLRSHVAAAAAAAAAAKQTAIVEVPEPVVNKQGSSSPESTDSTDEEIEEEEEDDMDVSLPNPRSRTGLGLGSAKSLKHAMWQPTDADLDELAVVSSIMENKPGIWDEDDEDTYDVSMVTEYGKEIFAYMRELEMQMLPEPEYMDAHSELDWDMRKLLLDWLVQVHSRFHLLPETLFLAVNYMDRFLTLKSNVSTGKLQLVGAVALYISAKYEEIHFPSIKEMAFMVEDQFTPDQIIKAEQYMISLLDFKLGWPGPMSFLRRTSKADDYELEIRTLAKYLLEITIMEKQFVACPPSYLSSLAHCLSRIMLERCPYWTQEHVFYSGYTLNQLKPGLKILFDCCKHPQEHHLSIYQKYQDRRYRRASVFVVQYMEAVGGELPDEVK